MRAGDGRRAAGHLLAMGDNRACPDVDGFTSDMIMLFNRCVSVRAGPCPLHPVMAASSPSQCLPASGLLNSVWIHAAPLESGLLPARAAKLASSTLQGRKAVVRSVGEGDGGGRLSCRASRVDSPDGINVDTVLKAVLKLARKHEVGVDFCTLAVLPLCAACCGAIPLHSGPWPQPGMPRFRIAAAAHPIIAPANIMHDELQLSKFMLLVSPPSIVQGIPSKLQGKAGDRNSCGVRRCPSIAAMRHLYWGCASSSVLQLPSIRRHGHGCTLSTGPSLHCTEYAECAVVLGLDPWHGECGLVHWYRQCICRCADVLLAVLSSDSLVL